MEVLDLDHSSCQVSMGLEMMTPMLMGAMSSAKALNLYEFNCSRSNSSLKHFHRSANWLSMPQTSLQSFYKCKRIMFAMSCWGFRMQSERRSCVCFLPIVVWLTTTTAYTTWVSCPQLQYPCFEELVREILGWAWRSSHSWKCLEWLTASSWESLCCSVFGQGSALANSFVRRRQIGMCGCTEWNVHQQRSERLLFCFGLREMPIALTREIISTRDLRFTWQCAVHPYQQISWKYTPPLNKKML